MYSKKIKVFALALSVAFLLTSCYSYTSVVGDGAQQKNEVTEWNHYLFWGLAPVDVSNSKEMADGADNYEVHTRQSFVNGLLSAITFGIYSPTTTTVTK